MTTSVHQKCIRTLGRWREFLDTPCKTYHYKDKNRKNKQPAGTMQKYQSLSLQDQFFHQVVTVGILIFNL